MLKKLKERLLQAAGFCRRNTGRILYYGGVALVLTAIALAAETGRKGEEAIVLPEAELSQAVEEVIAEYSLEIPGNMQRLRGFSDLPEWNAEKRQWESHEAVDYRVEGSVCCVQGGTVATIGESGVYGGFVELTCGDRLWRYASIAPDASLEVGMEIGAGECIGRADESMPGESLLGPHLHLELFVAGKSADPAAL